MNCVAEFGMFNKLLPSTGESIQYNYKRLHATALAIQSHTHTYNMHTQNFIV